MEERGPAVVLLPPGPGGPGSCVARRSSCWGRRGRGRSRRRGGEAELAPAAGGDHGGGSVVMHLELAITYHWACMPWLDIKRWQRWDGAGAWLGGEGGVGAGERKIGEEGMGRS